MVRASKHGKRQDTKPALKRDDIIASKGSGLIILLHGGPGTGKTLTAGEFRIHPTDVVLT
jgi:SpoVK/Ycf46/Vps4 family AAA+-type ATPase